MSVFSFPNDTVDKIAETVSLDVATERLGRRLAGESFSYEERRLAEQLACALLRDAAEAVRRNFAETLKSSPHLSHQLAIDLAYDVDSVALPILQFSKTLTDEDLVAIVQTGSPGKQTAIARRETVSSLLAEALVETNNPAAVSTLLANLGAEISDQTLDRAATRFYADDNVLETLRGRPELPITIAERLVAFTMDSLHSYIKRRSDLSSEVVSELVLKTRERSTLEQRAANFPSQEAITLVRHLSSAGRLTPSLILRALCIGDLAFFEVALATKAGIPLHNARKLIYDHGQLGLNSLYAAAKMPPAQLPAARAALEFAQEIQIQGGEADQTGFRQTMIERMLTRRSGTDGLDLEPKDMSYLMVRLEATRSIARA